MHDTTVRTWGSGGLACLVARASFVLWCSVCVVTLPSDSHHSEQKPLLQSPAKDLMMESRATGFTALECLHPVPPGLVTAALTFKHNEETPTTPDLVQLHSALLDIFKVSPKESCYVVSSERATRGRWEAQHHPNLTLKAPSSTPVNPQRQLLHTIRSPSRKTASVYA